MMLRRKGSTPFEIMGHAARRDEAAAAASAHAPAPAHTPEPVREARPRREYAERWPAASDWWARLGAGVPVVLRVPRGVAVLLVVALVGLLVLAYWVGHSRGAAAELARLEQQVEGAGSGMRGVPGAGGGSEQGAGGVAMAGAGYAGGQAGGADPREPGRNYFVVARYPPEVAESLSVWLEREHGVASVLESVQNDSLRLVIVTDRGFPPGELYTEPYEAYKSDLRAIGRAWQRHNRGRGDAFETMYPKRYDGP